MQVRAHKWVLRPGGSTATGYWAGYLERAKSFGRTCVNRLYYGDNYDVLRQHIADESVDLVYLDPPFNSDATCNMLFSEQDGSRAATQIKAFNDSWRWDGAAVRSAIGFVECPVVKVPSREELETAHCWLEHDSVPGDEELTDFRRAVRYHNAKWREANGYPIGAHRTRPGTPPRLIGSHLDRDFARETGATFLTDKARAAARIRSDLVEPHQRFDRQIFWADLLSSEALAVNLFGDLQADLDRADRAVHTWWPDAPGRVSEVRFYHSPGRFDPAYSNSLRSFDAMFVLDLDDGTQGAVAVDTRYREIANREGVKPSHLPRFTEIHDRSGAFAPGAVDVLSKSLLAVMWLEHVLLLSMLQHASGHWTWGRYVVVHPEGNRGTVRCTDEYQQLLADDATFASMTMEDLLGAKVLTQRTTAALRRRYIVR